MKIGEAPRKHVLRKKMPGMGDKYRDEEEETDELWGEPVDNNGSRSDNTTLTGLYSVEQTELYVPPPIIDGKVTRNAYGNIDVYVPSMVPEGGVLLRYPHIDVAAKMVGIDYANAVTGFDFGGTSSKGAKIDRGKRNGGRVAAAARIDGIVIATEYEEAVRAVYEQMVEEQEEENKEMTIARALMTWRRYLTALRIKTRLERQHGKVDDLELMEGSHTITEATEQEEGGFLPDDDANISVKLEGEPDHGGGGFIDEDHPSDIEGRNENFRGGDLVDEPQGGGGFVDSEGEGGGFIDSDKEGGFVPEEGGGFIDSNEEGGFVPEEGGGFIDSDEEGEYVSEEGGGFIDDEPEGDLQEQEDYFDNAQGSHDNEQEASELIGHDQSDLEIRANVPTSSSLISGESLKESGVFLGQSHVTEIPDLPVSKQNQHLNSLNPEAIENGDDSVALDEPSLQSRVVVISDDDKEDQPQEIKTSASGISSASVVNSSKGPIARHSSSTRVRRGRLLHFPQNIELVIIPSQDASCEPSAAIVSSPQKHSSPKISSPLPVIVDENVVNDSTPSDVNIEQSIPSSKLDEKKVEDSNTVKINDVEEDEGDFFPDSMSESELYQDYDDEDIEDF